MKTLRLSLAIILGFYTLSAEAQSRNGNTTVRNTSNTTTNVHSTSNVRAQSESGVRARSESRNGKVVSPNNPRINSQPRQSGNTFSSNEFSSAQNSNIIRIDRQPEAQNFSRNSVRFTRSTSERTIYYSGNTGNFDAVRHNNYNYYMDNGYFYQFQNNRYRRVAAPFGMRIHQLPQNHLNIYIGGSHYHYYHGTFYVLDYDSFYVVQPPVGAIVSVLPADYERVFINGRRYYEYFGVLYAKVNFNGRRAYQVMGYLY